MRDRLSRARLELPPSNHQIALAHLDVFPEILATGCDRIVGSKAVTPTVENIVLESHSEGKLNRRRAIAIYYGEAPLRFEIFNGGIPVFHDAHAALYRRCQPEAR
jgi:hypothetical protein